MEPPLSYGGSERKCGSYPGVSVDSAVVAPWSGYEGLLLSIRPLLLVGPDLVVHMVALVRIRAKALRFRASGDVVDVSYPLGRRCSSSCMGSM